MLCSSLKTALPLALAVALTACGGSSSDRQPTASAAATSVTLSAMAAVGEQLFFDQTLSASGRQSCASCHDPDHAFGAPNALSVQLGGPALDRPGLRNTPTLTYALYTPAFSVQADGTPIGGFFLDGRSDSLADQAEHPLTNAFEMANADNAIVLRTLQTRPYINQFTQVFGSAVLDDADAAVHSIGQAIAAFEKEDLRFHRFDSKFDAVSQGRAAFTAQELNGFALFNRPAKGNCAACHVSTPANGLPALFTDHTYDNLGVPRNWAIAANTDPTPAYYGLPENGTALGAPYAYYDLGLCGPIRSAGLGTSHCGQFKVPSLRNIALKQSYFHNGVFHTLQDAVDFYITRDTDPTRWYVQADGVTPDVAYNDLPAAYTANVNVLEAPYNPAVAPTLNAQERKDLIAFLCTLSDGYDPGHPDNYYAAGAATNPAQCQQARQ